MCFEIYHTISVLDDTKGLHVWSNRNGHYSCIRIINYLDNLVTFKLYSTRDCLYQIQRNYGTAEI